MKQRCIKKFVVFVLGSTMAIALVGCGHKHTWTEATCTSPKTCSECGETEGQTIEHTWIEATCALPKTCSECGETEGQTIEHTWIEATCASPKTCSICGEIEGEALEHNLTEANYQQASVCTVCGQSVGEVLKPSNSEGFFSREEAELGVEYTYCSACKHSETEFTNAKIVYSDYRVFESDDTHESVEGYEWHAVTVTIEYSDDIFMEYGRRTVAGMNDIYENPYDSYDNGKFTVNYYGIDYEDCLMVLEKEPVIDTETSQFYIAHLSVRVPVGYDGIYFYYENPYVKGNEDNYVVFRMNK